MTPEQTYAANKAMPAPVVTITTTPVKTVYCRIQAETIHGPQHASIELCVDWVTGELVVVPQDFSEKATLRPSFDVEDRFFS